METFENIIKRRSVRKFISRPIEDEIVHKILEAGMSAPSAVNKKEWEFIVVRSKETMDRIREGFSASAPLETATLAIVMLADYDKAYENGKEFWIIDTAAAAENMLLAANGLNIGSLWLGVWPRQEKVERIREVFSLPGNIMPHSVLAFGYPDGPINEERESRYDEKKVHIEKW